MWLTILNLLVLQLLLGAEREWGWRGIEGEGWGVEEEVYTGTVANYGEVIRED